MKPIFITPDYEVHPSGAIWSNRRKGFLKIAIRPGTHIPVSHLVLNNKPTVVNLNKMVLKLFGPSALVNDHITAAPPDPGFKHPRNAKLTAAQVAEIRSILASPHPPSLRKIGEMFGISPMTVIQIRRGVTWKSIAPGVAIPAQGESDAETDC